MDPSFFLRPLLTGLSVGVFCLTYCFPFMAPFLGAEERSLGKNFRVLLEFLLGRFAGYLGFGILAGYFGERFDSRWLRIATDLSFVFLAMILFLYLTGLIRKNDLFCQVAGPLRSKSPLFMGFFRLLLLTFCGFTMVQTS